MTGALVPDARRPPAADPPAADPPAPSAPNQRPALAAVSPQPSYRGGVGPTPPGTEPGAAVGAGGAVPVEFAEIAAALRAALSRTRPEVVLTETPGPSKIAPHGFAVTASVSATASAAAA